MKSYALFDATNHFVAVVHDVWCWWLVGDVRCRFTSSHWYISVADITDAESVQYHHEERCIVENNECLDMRQKNITCRLFVNLAGAVYKISESVKKIEQNFDNALGSTSNANDSNAWSPEFVPFMGPKDGSGTVGSYSAKK
ncbi:hypothetical protein Tco_0762323 [Tanacetum coccineum]